MRKGVSTLDDLLDGAAARLPLVGRHLFHVDALHAEASDSNEGRDRERPLATIAEGYARCVTDRGDTIRIHGGDHRYREDELTIEKDGIRIIGDGFGTEWNRTSEQSGDYVVKVQAKNVIIANIQISVNGSEDAVYWGDGGSDNDNAALGELLGCLIRGSWYTATGSEGVIGLTIDGSSYGPKVVGKTFYGWGTGIDVSDGANRTAYGVQIIGNYITGKTYGINWANAAYGYTSVIAENTIWDWKSSVNMTYGINLAVVFGGVLVCRNTIACSTGVADDGDLNYWVGNHVETAEAASEANCIVVGTW